MTKKFLLSDSKALIELLLSDQAMLFEMRLIVLSSFLLFFLLSLFLFSSVSISQTSFIGSIPPLIDEILIKKYPWRIHPH